ncbi:hypothetical protein KKG65_03845, partial [Patescibacteria group bacterium]|nr:hypothetical protein [Patescibacteria group bacterium]
LQPWFKMRVITNINKNEFVPVPKVNVVLAELRKRKQPLVEEQFRQWYRDFVVYGYNQWQPTILDAFKDVFTSKQRHLLANNLEIKKTKPSDLTITQWLKLFEVFMAHTTPEGKKVVEGSESRLRKQQKGLKKLHRTR